MLRRPCLNRTRPCGQSKTKHSLLRFRNQLAFCALARYAEWHGAACRVPFPDADFGMRDICHESLQRFGSGWRAEEVRR